MSLYRPRQQLKTIRCVAERSEDARYCLKWQPDGNYLALYFDGPMGIRRGTVQSFGIAMRGLPQDVTEGWFERPRFMVDYTRHKSPKAAKWAVRYWIRHGIIHAYKEKAKR